ncbi:MAG: family 78 glycoside hydrolase catalytic domain [Bacteroides sp.]|nr:family 78 glycoside hydrolase catalytic domain [Bacteroides eggerthii]MDU6394330.1 family 78 glycoside hydrolase catalytic domain [Bacteroides sp.]
MATATNIERIRCEYLKNPLGIDVATPRFTWEISADHNGKQTACRLNVATSPQLLKCGKADIWKSGRVNTDISRMVYQGPALQAHTRYYWQVEVWSNGRKLTSEVASFETAKLSITDWHDAKWISDTFDKEFRKAPLLRKSISLEEKNIKNARLYVSGVGYYEFFINGAHVSDRKLEPGYTHFDKRVLYSTYDVTSMLQHGENVLAAELGNGWLNIQSLSVWEFEKARWRMRPRMIAELRITYNDGTVQTIPTDRTWKTNSGACSFNNLYSGEVYDARLVHKGWTTPGFDDKKWMPAIEVEAPAKILTSQQMPPIRVVREVKPVSMRKIDDYTYMYDMGENMTGVCRIQVQGPTGTCVTLAHGELIHDDGTLNQGNIEIYFKREKNGLPQHVDPFERIQTDTYFLSGNGMETYEPRFTYHGFRYVEVTSTRPLTLTQESLTGLCMHTDVESVGNFACSNEILNKLVEASCNSYLGNLFSIPTDCPQREKNGWTADGYVGMDYGLLFYDGITVYEKWMNDFIDNQRERGDLSGIIPSSGWGYADWIGPVWDAALFIIPNNLYKYYGDTRAIEKMWDTCVRYLQYLETREKDGKLTYGIGDWVFYKAKTDTHFTSTAFYWLDNVLMAKFADLTGHDGTKYRAKADNLKELINNEWFDAEKKMYANGTQAAQSVGLALGLVPEEHAQAVADNLVRMIRDNGHQLDFGMLGSKFVPAMLVKYGYADDAYKMIIRPEAPSWANWIHRGLTTLPETWVLDKDFKDASLNHAFLGDISAWMMNSLAGINPNPKKPGFAGIIIRPQFIKGISWAKGEYRSVRGLIRSEWKREGNQIELNIIIPANTEAELQLRDKSVALKTGKNQLTINL